MTNSANVAPRPGEQAERPRRFAKAFNPRIAEQSLRALDRFVAEEPWEGRDLVHVIRAATVGLLAIGVSWFGANQATDWSRQMLWIALSVGAALLTATGMVRFVTAGLGTVRIARRDVLDTIYRRFSDSAPRSGFAGHGQLVESDARVIVKGLVRYHRPTCQLVQGKPVSILKLADPAASGLSGCGMCGS